MEQWKTYDVGWRHCEEYRDEKGRKGTKNGKKDSDRITSGKSRESKKLAKGKI